MPSTLRAASDAIPTRLKPPLLVLMNLVLSTAFSYFASPWIYKDVTAIQRPMTSLSDYMGLVGWRIIELMCHWVGGWDGTTLALQFKLVTDPIAQNSDPSSFPSNALSRAIHALHAHLPTVTFPFDTNPCSCRGRRSSKSLSTTLISSPEPPGFEVNSRKERE